METRARLRGRLIAAAALALALTSAPGVGSATVLNFESLRSTPGLSLIPDGYGGLDWEYMWAMWEDSQACGYTVGRIGHVAASWSTVSGPGAPLMVTVSASSGTFDFNGAYLTAWCNNGLNVRMEGLRGGGVAFDQTVVANPTTRTYFQFNYWDIDALRITSSGGTQGSCCGPQEALVIDNFRINDRICGNGDVEPPEECDGGACCTGSCQYQAPGEVCRAAAGQCDLQENCTGGSATCPADSKSTAECRAAAEACDVAESCDGTNNDCPADGFDTGTQCRASAGVCDLAESCDGSGPNCPTDGKSTAECRPVTGACDVAESCDGANNDCPGDGFEPNGTACNDENICTQNTACDGAGNCGGGEPQLCIDHFKCYKAKDLKNPKLEAQTVGLADQFAVNDGFFEVKKPFLVCNPTDKNGEGVNNPTDHLTCYKLKGPKLDKNDRPHVEVVNQLGMVQLEAKKPFLLCVPSAKTVLP